MEGSTIVIAAFILYFAAILAIGFYHAKNIQNNDDFLLAGRNVGFWILLGTIVGTNVGGGTFVGITAGAFSNGVSSIWPFVGTYVFISIWALLFVRYVNRIRQYTVPDFLVMRFGERVRVPAALFMMLRAIVNTGLQLLAMASIMSVVLGWSLGLSMTVSLVITIVYCLAGGFYSVVVTDFIQTILQTVGPILLVILLITQAGGIGEVFSVTSQENSGTYDLLTPGWAVILGLIAASGPYYLVYQPMWQRAYAARDEDTAFKAMMWGTVISFLSVLLAVLLGISARLAAPAGIDPNDVLGFLYLEYLPPLVGAFFAVSLIAAIMSVLDSMVLDGTANFVRDIYQRTLNPNASEQQLVLMSRVAVVVISLLGLVMAILLPNLILLFVLANALAAGGVVVPALAAWFWRGATAAGAFWSIAGGGGCTIVWSAASWIINGSPEQPIVGINAVYVGFVVGTLMMVLVSRNTLRSEDESPEATLFKRSDLRRRRTLPDAPSPSTGAQS